MSSLPTGGTGKKKLDDDIPMLAITTNMANTDENEQEKEGLESYEQPTEQEFNPHLPVLCALASHVDGTEADTPDLRKFIEAQLTVSDYGQAATSVGKRNSMIEYDIDRVLVRVFLVDGASQRYVPTVLRPRILLLCHYSLFCGHQGKRRM